MSYEDCAANIRPVLARYRHVKRGKAGDNADNIEDIMAHL
jgi:hypothetical protein